MSIGVNSMNPDIVVSMVALTTKILQGSTGGAWYNKNNNILLSLLLYNKVPFFTPSIPVPGATSVPPDTVWQSPYWVGSTVHLGTAAGFKSSVLRSRSRFNSASS
jgi:hypothetical protein